MICDVHGVEGCKSPGCQMWQEASGSEGIVVPDCNNIGVGFGDKNMTFTIDSQGKVRIVPDEKPKGFQNIILSWIDRHIWIETKLGSNEPPKRVWKWKVARR